MDNNAYQDMAAIEDHHWWFVGRRRIIKKVLDKLAKSSGLKILEVGSGTGGNSQLLSTYGELTSIEKNLGAIKIAQQKNPDHEYLPCDVPDELSIIDNQSFDIIIMLDVLEHLKEDLLTLEILKTKLKTDGKILITTPAFPSLWSGHDSYHHHYRRYTKSQLDSMMIKADFKVEYRSFFNTFLFVPIWLFRNVQNFLNHGDYTNDELNNGYILNLFFKYLFSLESMLLPYIKFPFGVSHIYLVKK